MPSTYQKYRPTWKRLYKEDGRTTYEIAEKYGCSAVTVLRHLNAIGVDTSRPQRSDEKRFWAKVDRGAPDQCWTWTASTNNCGYGRFFAGGASVLAHRYSFEVHHRPLAEGEVVRHTCDQPGCVNPHHLKAGTHQDNMNDMVRRDRQARGSRCAQSKLEESDIRVIRARYREGSVTQAELANTYGTTRSAISKIVRRTRWKHVQ